MLATVHSFSRSRNCARTVSLSVGGGFDVVELEFVSGTVLVVEFEFVLLLTESFVFELLFETIMGLVFLTTRGIKTIAATTKPTSARISTPSIPTTHGHGLLFLTPSG